MADENEVDATTPPEAETPQAEEENGEDDEEDDKEDDKGGFGDFQDREGEYNDNVGEMTYGRRLARYFSGNKKYYPHLEDRAAHHRSLVISHRSADGGRRGDDGLNPPPSLDVAWAYYEHIVLPRYHVNAPKNRTRGILFNRKSRDEYQKAEAGESDSPTKLYPVWATPEKQLADFGIGVGLYFSTLRVLALICFVAGLINIPAIHYYSSDDYSADKQNEVETTLLKGSALCTSTRWSACPECKREDFEIFPEIIDRFATSEDGNFNFIRVNNCNVDRTLGVTVFACLVFVTVSIFVTGIFNRREETALDLAQQTASDYSVEVENPPTDARDPQEWKEFFEQFPGSHVTVCTVALDNEELVRALAKREKLVLKFENMTPRTVPFYREKIADLVSQIPEFPWWKRMLPFLFPTPQKVYAQIQELELLIDDLSKKEFSVSNVFVSFETEQGQRSALEALSVKRWDAWTQRTDAVPPEHLFRGKLLLVREPDEPSSIRWEDLDESITTRTIQFTITTILSLLAVAGGGVIIFLARLEGPAYAALAITALNTITPKVVKFIIKFESHPTETAMQTSQYIKITFFRWINTAIITTIITPFTDTVTQGSGYLIASVYAIFVTEMVKSPILQVLDIAGNVKRHILGPRAPDQRRMNINFSGAVYELAERYTDMTKVLFLTFFYSTIFPSAFFFAAVTLTVHYWTDKFCLLRNWAPAPKIGTEIAVFSRNYFFTTALFVYGAMAAYHFASFPFDNACNSLNPVSSDYAKEHEIVTGDDRKLTISISSDDTQFFFCNQDVLRMKGVFPAHPRAQRDGDWMTDGQENYTEVLGWTSIVVLVWVGLVLFNRVVVEFCRDLFGRKPYRPVGEATTQKFSNLKEVFGYVPQIRIPGHVYPKLLCDVRGIDEGLIGWTDPYDDEKTYKGHNLMLDIPAVAKMMEEPRADDDYLTSVFSIVKNWPPGADEGEIDLTGGIDA